MQVRSAVYMSQSYVKEGFERYERIVDEDVERFFKLFQESTFEVSRAAARKMRKFAKGQIKHNQKVLLFHGLSFLIHSESEKLSWPNSPLLVMLQLLDPNVLCGDENAPLQEGETRFTPLYELANMTDPSNYSTHQNQLILAKQLIQQGANVNAVTIPERRTALHNACHWRNVTNLDFVELLLEAGADPNSQNHLGRTPLMCTTPDAPGAAKFLLNWPTTDVKFTTRSGVSFLALVRSAITEISNEVALLDHPEQVPGQFLLQQWREIEEMLVFT
jgi:hypothetical protein